MIDFVLPRDEYELSEIFEDLLFMRTHKFDREWSPKDPVFILTPTQINHLGCLGITNRIFRRWYQTTWGYNNPSKHFTGETPRQELSVRYPNLVKGQNHLAVELVSIGNGAKVAPRLSLSGDIDKAGGIFMLGRESLPKTKIGREQFSRLPAPNYDPDFKSFVSSLEQFERQVEKNRVFELPQEKEARYWKLFWSDLGLRLTLNSGLELPHDTLIFVGVAVQLLFNGLHVRQGSGRDNYIDFDEFFYNLWTVISPFDKRLLSFEKITSRQNRTAENILKQKNGSYSLAVYYNLSNLLDELFLFPADQYFGAVECVWSDKQNFMNDLVMTYDLLKGNHRPVRNPNLPQLPPVIEERMGDIYSLWFAPPTAFRFLSNVLDLI